MASLFRRVSIRPIRQSGLPWFPSSSLGTSRFRATNGQTSVPKLELGSQGVETSSHGARKLRRKTLKRAFDIVVAGTLLAVFSVPMLATGLAIRWLMGSPVLFRQERPGRGGKTFLLYKFRTMTDERDAEGRRLSDSRRLTRLGRLLRRTSLDELPQLFNVLAGQMSLVGPRPLLSRYMPYYTRRELLRHGVTPGITGWAQVHGRNNLDWDRRLALDVWYAENQSFGLDMKILLLTFWAVFGRKGVVEDPQSVMLDLDQERMHRHEEAGRAANTRR